MKNCSNKSFRRGVLSLLAATPFIILACCTSVDDRLGSGLIPQNQRGIPGVVTLGRESGQEIKAYILYTDTVYTQNQSMALFGKAKGAYNSGITRTAMVMQFLPDAPRVDTTGNGFGFDVTIDSITFNTQMIHILGDNNIEQTFHIYNFKDLADSLTSDTSYYMSFDWRSRIDNTKPMFEFKYKGGSVNKSVEEIVMYDDQGKDNKINPEGMLYLKELLSDTTWYWNTSNAPNGSESKVTASRVDFRSKFPGFIIAPAPSSPDDAAIYEAGLIYTSLDIHFHNYKTEGNKSDENIKDTVDLAFYMYDQELLKYIPRNNSVICVEHDYSGTQYDFLDPKMDEPVASPDGRGHVQGICGFNTVIELPDGIFDAIENLKEKASDDIFISQAMLYIWMDNPNSEPITDVMNRSHAKFGSYIKYSNWNPIADYAYYDEANGSTIPYNGKLNRSHGYYEFNITSYMHHAYRKNTPRRFTLGPTAYTPTYNTNPNNALDEQETELIIGDNTPGDGNRQAMIKLKYILVK